VPKFLSAGRPKEITFLTNLNITQPTNAALTTENEELPRLTMPPRVGPLGCSVYPSQQLLCVIWVNSHMMSNNRLFTTAT